jgi:CTP synthase
LGNTIVCLSKTQMEIIKSKNDFYTSVEKAFDEIDPKWRTYKGIVVVGSHVPTEVPAKLESIRLARLTGIPFLGICMGMQLACVEYAKNVLGIERANTQEIDPLADIVVKMPKLRVGIFKVGGAMESHWHNYKVNEDFIDLLGVHFDTISSTEFPSKVLEYIKLKGHPHFVGVQFHPEYQSYKDKPHPVLVDFLRACKKAPVNQTGA